MSTSVRSGTTLESSLAHRLPDLTTALNAQHAAQQIEQVLLDGRARVVSVAPGSIWYRDDGSCALRYTVEVATGAAGSMEATVLARVYPSREAARRYLVDAVDPLVPNWAPPEPWLRWAGQCQGEASVVIHLFPIDPAIPTLRHAVDLATPAGETWPWEGGTPTSVDLVHHARRGTAVLRYGLAAPATQGDGAAHVYGKVYGDGTGAVVESFLRSVRPPLGEGTVGGAFTVPEPLAYSPGLRLLLTGSVPGRLLLPDLVRVAFSVPERPDVEDGLLPQALRSTGEALAMLHTVGAALAPMQQPEQSAQSLTRELDLVATVWPDEAATIRSRLGGHADQPTSPADVVLCHGDFTPSQLLFTEGVVTGVVDFDTVCWGDAAMDLGRFLAHLDLLLAKVDREGGPLRSTTLHGEFLQSYLAAAPSAQQRDTLLDRVAAFWSIALAWSALHACRQLKQDRLWLALSLLRTGISWTRRTQL
jgi:hypothetical protein